MFATLYPGLIDGPGPIGAVHTLLHAIGCGPDGLFLTGSAITLHICLLDTCIRYVYENAGVYETSNRYLIARVDVAQHALASLEHSES